jgi:hypothetical protein
MKRSTQFKVISQQLSGGTVENHEKVNVVSVLEEIRSRQRSNTNLNRYCMIQLSQFVH